MKLYTISELEKLSSDEIIEIINSRYKLFTKLTNDAIIGKKVETIGSKAKEINGRQEKRSFPIKNIEYLENKNPLFGQDVAIIPINIILDGYDSKSKNGTLYHDHLTTSSISNLLQKKIEKDITIHWSAKKLQGQNHVSFDLLFPIKLIAPDIIAYIDYNPDWNSKKIISKIIDNEKKQKLENKLLKEIEEIQNNKFNLIKEKHAYVPDNKEELMEFIQKYSKIYDKDALNEVVKKYPDNKEIVLAAIGLFNDEVFKYASDKLKDDREFVNYCIENHKGNILEFASERLRDDESLLLKAIKSVGGQIMRAASDRLKNDKNIALIAIQSQAMAYTHISENLKTDEEVISILIEQKPDFFKPPPIIRNNKELLIKAFKNAYPDSSNLLLEYTSDELKNDTQVALAAIECSPRNIEYIGQKLKDEIGDFEPFAYLKNIDLYKEMHNEMTNDNSSKRKPKM
jgi:hypothetical protein